MKNQINQPTVIAYADHKKQYDLQDSLTDPYPDVDSFNRGKIFLDVDDNAGYAEDSALVHPMTFKAIGSAKFLFCNERHHGSERRFAIAGVEHPAAGAVRGPQRHPQSRPPRRFHLSPVIMQPGSRPRQRSPRSCVRDGRGARGDVANARRWRYDPGDPLAGRACATRGADRQPHPSR